MMTYISLSHANKNNNAIYSIIAKIVPIHVSTSKDNSEIELH